MNPPSSMRRGAVILALSVPLLVSSGVAGAVVAGTHGHSPFSAPSSASATSHKVDVRCSTYFRRSVTEELRRGPVFHVHRGKRSTFDYTDIQLRFFLTADRGHEPLHMYATVAIAESSTYTLFAWPNGTIEDTYGATRHGFTGGVVVHDDAGHEVQYICRNAAA